MSKLACEICFERKSGMRYAKNATCFPCLDLAVTYYLEQHKEE